jgi:hypothetical protein
MSDLTDDRPAQQQEACLEEPGPTRPPRESFCDPARCGRWGGVDEFLSNTLGLVRLPEPAGTVIPIMPAAMVTVVLPTGSQGTSLNDVLPPDTLSAAPRVIATASVTQASYVTWRAGSRIGLLNYWRATEGIDDVGTACA